MSNSQELKKYLYYIDKIKPGINVAAIDCEYEGLSGVITDVLSGNKRETDNDCMLDVIVDFYIPPYAFAVKGDGSSVEKWINKYYPQLNGTSISQVVMSEDMLAYMFNDIGFYITLEGQAICPNCSNRLDKVQETQYEDIEWNFVNGKYLKKNLPGSTNGIRCPYCNEKIIDSNSKYFRY